MPARWLGPAAALLLAASGAGCFQTLNTVDMSDAGITARLRSDLQAKPELSVQYMDLDTHAGVVTISGIVGSLEDREAIVRIARRLKGVRQVVANLVIRQ